MGLLLAVVVHAANIQDRDGAMLVLAKLLGRFPRLQLIWADAGYAGRLVTWAWTTGGWVLTVVKRKPDSHQFEVLPRRWVVERTLAWLSRCRRLSKDYEERTESSEAWVHIAMVNLMLKRLQPTRTHLSHTLLGRHSYPEVFHPISTAHGIPIMKNAGSIAYSAHPKKGITERKPNNAAGSRPHSKPPNIPLSNGIVAPRLMRIRRVFSQYISPRTMNQRSWRTSPESWLMR